MLRFTTIAKYLFLLIPVLFFQFCRAQPADKIRSNKNENSLLWEISGKDLSRPSYLFGTFHLMCKEDITLSENLKEAVINAKEVYFEMDLDDPSNTLGGIFFMKMKDGMTLKQLYSEEEYNRLEHYFKDSLQTNMQMFQNTKPTLLEAFIYPKLMACKTLSGMEGEIMGFAKKEKKEIKGFETIAFQMAVFDSLPYKDQAKLLLEMIDSIPVYSKYFQTMLTVYKNQEISKLEQMFNDPQFNMSEKDQDILLDRRNINWVDQIKKIIPSTNLFIAVGAGHLVGENGLINLLRKEGYTVRALENK